MANIKVYNLKGEDVSSLKLNDEVFKQEFNEALIHQVIVALLANARQGTKSALSRAEVKGHAKKPWKQKHTGRARHGSTKAPQWRGGGVVFAPKPRDFSKKVNKEAKRAALKSAKRTKLANKELIVVEDLNLTSNKTKDFVSVLKNLDIAKTAILVTKENNDNLLRASANLSRIDVTTSDLLNVYDIVACDKLILTVDAVKSIEEAYNA